jgi:hypothetical protein
MDECVSIMQMGHDDAGRPQRNAFHSWPRVTAFKKFEAETLDFGVLIGKGFMAADYRLHGACRLLVRTQFSSRIKNYCMRRVPIWRQSSGSDTLLIQPVRGARGKL